MAKSRYSPELIEVICNAIAIYGTDESGWQAGSISETTFYRWEQSNEEFREFIGKAKADYRNSHRNNVRRLGRKNLLDYLKGNMVKVSHVRKEVFSPSGEIVEIEEHRTTPVGVPQWAVERALGADMTEVDALFRLAELDIIPSWVVDCADKILDKARQEIKTLLCGELPEPLLYELSKERESTGGLSEDTYNRIRAEIMGIDAKGAIRTGTTFKNVEF